MKEVFDSIKRYLSRYNIEFKHILLWLSLGAIFQPSKFKSLLEVFNLSILKDFKDVSEVFIQIYFDLIVWLFFILIFFLILDSIDTWIQKKSEYEYSISGENWSFGVATLRISNILIYLSVDIFVYLVLLIFLADGNIQVESARTVNQFTSFQSSIFILLMLVNIVVSIVNTFKSIFTIPSFDEDLFPKIYIEGTEYIKYTKLRKLNTNHGNYMLLKNKDNRYYIVKQEQITSNKYVQTHHYKVLNTTKNFSEAVYSFESNK